MRRQKLKLFNEFASYLLLLTNAILENQGWLDKYIGDAAMGVFGVPPVTEQHALRALRAAVRMKERLAVLNIELGKRGLPVVSCGIGLCARITRPTSERRMIQVPSLMPGRALA